METNTKEINNLKAVINKLTEENREQQNKHREELAAKDNQIRELEEKMAKNNAQISSIKDACFEKVDKLKETIKLQEQELEENKANDQRLNMQIKELEHTIMDKQIDKTKYLLKFQGVRKIDDTLMDKKKKIENLQQKHHDETVQVLKNEMDRQIKYLKDYKDFDWEPKHARFQSKYDKMSEMYD